MEKSIEAIWKEGFTKGDALLAPKLNDLYNQKSINIVDKLKKMFTINLVAIGGFSVSLLIAAIFVGIPYVGLFLCTLFFLLVVVGRKALERLERIDKGFSSYQYLKAFDNWFKTTIADYTRIYRVFYPVCFLTCVIGGWFSRPGELLRDKLLTAHPDIYLVSGIPIFWFLGIVVFAVVLGFFAGVIYRLDMNLVYGREMKKLDELIADMEELRN